MTRQEIVDNINQLVLLNGFGDLAMSGELRPFINKFCGLRIVNLTKSGMALLEIEGKEMSVPPRNVDLYKGV